MKKTIVAICYDFDKTLSTDDMQAFSFIPNLGLTSKEFWGMSNGISKQNKMDNILGYMKCMIDMCKEKNIRLTLEYLFSLGKDVEFFIGVKDWFKRINQYAKLFDLQVEHYIISSGNKEIIDGTEIAKEFKEIYGCEFLYNEDGVAFWPKTMVNYTQKTQYLFRISKGAYDLTDNETVNRKIKKHRIEFKNMIYIGDGMTDVPCMTLVKEKGGNSISVYKKESKDTTTKLITDGRVNYSCVADYTENSPLDGTIKCILQSISIQDKLIKMS